MARSGDEGLEQRLDRWVEAGRQFVDGVSGARPGSRSPARSSSRRPSARLNPAELGRWVETKLDWLLEDDASDDWREPWQPSRSRAQPADPEPRGRRRPLEAISRRPSAPVVSAAASADALDPASADAAGEWPDDALFSVPRWQRQPDPSIQPPASRQNPEPQGRPLPRSSRRR